MFTGIVEAVSIIRALEKHPNVTSFCIETPAGWDLNIGQSIAVNGTCLTVTSFDKTSFNIDMMEETLSNTIFGSALPVRVNLERAMPANGRFEGHIVQGHVDTVGQVIVVPTVANDWRLTVSYATAFDGLVVPKGSVTINGVSLTVVDPTPKELSVALIPHTLESTTLGMLKEGDQVNLEFDILGKYLQR